MICIPNKDVPIIIPFGHRCIGKTLMIHRLIRYLLEDSYCCTPERTFRNDKEYESICKEHEKVLFHKGTIPVATLDKGDILLEILDRKNNHCCYLFDCCGERFCNADYTLAEMSSYLTEIIDSPNPKIWLFMYDAAPCLDENERCDYVNAIRLFYSSLDYKKNKAVCVLSKADKCFGLFKAGKIDKDIAFDKANELYHNFMKQFEERHIVSRLLHTDKWQFVPFCSGEVIYKNDENYEFIPGPNEFPMKLWNTLITNFK